ncbi:hypothetical protein V2A60_004364 [Cordyceps javanica]|uniref:Uncharacterized protein n=1 Tax=Cordyceps javanica TaxID=43265 RepID=A0A545URH2_9HYPO|nr:hypothetical protein IF1G_09130 [Cordyceps javanica]TQW04152.1 hypothetical protein IF2G_08466 [Cordyceps javanica]
MSHDIKPLWLVQPRLDAAEYRDKLIGSVVKYPNLPTERHIPYQTEKLPKEMVMDLDPKPVRMRNVAFWQNRIKDARVSASFNDIMQFFAQRAQANKAANVATVARMWHMDSPGEKFKALLRNKQYYDELFALLRSNHDQGYFVTDIVTVANLETTESRERGAGAGAGVKVPLDPSLVGVDVGAEASFHVAREKGSSVTYDEEMIVFIGYRLVRLEKLTGKRAKLRAMLLGQKHGFSVHDGSDYWPEIKDGPVPGQVEPFLGSVPAAAMMAAASEQDTASMARRSTGSLLDEAIVRELNFDVEVVG